MGCRIHMVIVALLLYSSLAHACSAAYQYSLFPLGSSQGQLIVLEVEMNRYLTSPGMPAMRMGPGRNGSGMAEVQVRWKGTLKLLIQQGDTLVLQEDLGYADILDNDYQAALQKNFEHAYRTARALPYFEEAKLESVGHCSYELGCNWMYLSIDTAKVGLYAHSTEAGYDQDSLKVAFKVTDLLKVEKTTTIPFTDFENVDKEFQINFMQLWSPQTVRRYNIGGRMLKVYSIGRGSRSRYTPLASTVSRQAPPLENIGHYIQGNDVLFHGQRFDVWHWVE